MQDYNNPQTLNRYTYVLNNPLKYTDPTGHFADWIIDALTIAFDVGQMVAEPSWENGGYLAADVILGIVPFVPAGVGPVAKGVQAGVKNVKGADKAAEGAKVIDKGSGLLAKAEELGSIKNHLSKLDYAVENDAMIERINTKIEKGEALTGADAEFYVHELEESRLMDNGMGYETAHQKAMAKYNVCEWDLYDPAAVQAADASNGGWRSFADDYYDYWGIK